MITWISTIWFSFLYQPVFNALIWIYTNIANENLGWTVVWLTVFLRIAILPLTIVSVMNEMKHEKAKKEAEEAMKSFKNDQIARKEVARSIMKKHKISPWAKVAALGIQFLMLVLLYQVFIRGISGEKIIKILYPFIDFPGQINVFFYGFDIGRVHDSLWAGAASAYLLISILYSNRNKKVWNKNEMFYVVFFPLFTFFALWFLPMVKSLFILTSMVFSDTITLIMYLFFKKKIMSLVVMVDMKQLIIN